MVFQPLQLTDMAKVVKFNRARIVIAVVLLFIIIMMVIDLRIERTCDCSDNLKDRVSEKDFRIGSKPPKHRLAVLIPHRDRFEEMLQFLPYMHNFLEEQNVPHRFYIINQADGYRFNRASLLNIGYLYSLLECDYIAMHDIDLMPVNKDISYSYDVVESGPHHVSSPELHPMYHYKTYVGGIFLMKNEDFKLVNGLSNRYWGWGREDDEFYKRMKESGLKISRPAGITTGDKTFKHIHDKKKRPRDYKRIGQQKEVQFQRDFTTGLDTLKYQLLSSTEITLGSAPATVLNVHLDCDVSLTPWCEY